MARRVSGIVLLGGLVVSASLAACAATEERRTPSAPPAAATLDLPALAATKVTADTLDTAPLTAAFRAALTTTSGVRVVDQAQVETALLSCAIPPCEAELAAAYASAPIVFSASIAKAGEGSYLGSGRALEGTRVLKRSAKSGSDPVEVIQEIGWELGAAVHAELKGRASAGEGS